MYEICRRDLILGAAGAFAAFGIAKKIAFIGAAEAQPASGPAFKKFMIGDIEVTSLYDGVWEKAHDENFIKGANVEQTKGALKAGGLSDAFVPVTFTALAVKTSEGLVLMDTGTGGQTGGPKAGLLPQSMAAAGIDPKSIKKIIISHFHGDHVSGLMAKDTNAQLFPDAEIIVPEAELKFWTQPVENIAKGRQGQAQRVQATLAKWSNVKVVAGEADLAPGIRAIPAFGHTEGHTAHLISSGGKMLYSTVDAASVASLFVRNPTWRVAFDHVPDMAVETRKKLFDRAIADKAMVSGYHWGAMNVGTLAKDGDGYAFVAA